MTLLLCLGLPLLWESLHAILLQHHTHILSQTHTHTISQTQPPDDVRGNCVKAGVCVCGTDGAFFKASGISLPMCVCVCVLLSSESAACPEDVSSMSSW